MTMLALRRQLRRAAYLAGIPVVLSGPDTAPHWACPDCGMPCYCVDPLARLSPHRPCNQREVIAA